MNQNNKYIFALTVLLSISVCGFGQSIKKKVADKYFNQLEYYKAVDYYKDIVNTKKPDEDDLRKIALCYFHLNDYKLSEKYFQMLVDDYYSVCTVSDLIYYYQCLKYNENYSKVKATVSKLRDKNADSKISKLNKEAGDFVSDLKLDSARYNIFNIDKLNTEYSDYSTYYDVKSNRMYFTSNRRNVSVKNKTFGWDGSYFTDTYLAKKYDSLDFGELTTLPKNVNTLYHDGVASLSKDGNMMFITRTVNVKDKKKQIVHVNLKLIIYKKDSKGDWDEGVEFPYCSNDYSLGHATISADGNRLYFVSDMPGGFGQTDIWYSDKANNSWGKPVNLGSVINTDGREMFPYLFDEGTLMFSSDGRAGLGGLDLCYAVIDNTTCIEARVLGYPLNTHYDDFSLFLNPDLKTGYISSNRSGGKGKDDIYFFNSRLPIIGKSVSGVVIDAITKKPVSNAKIYLLDINDDIIDTVTADKDGNYKIPTLNDSKVKKMAVLSNPEYADKTLALKDLKTGTNNQNLALMPNHKMNCVVTEATSSKPVDSVKIVVTDLTNKKEEIYYTDSKGLGTIPIKDKHLGDNVNYEIKLLKDGYITVAENYNAVLDSNVNINLNKIITCSMQKLEKGVDIAKSIKINPIYFDYGKWNVRPDASIELDKIVKTMNENPTIVIELGSHTDCRSSSAYNMQLSNKRAKASADYIISKGVKKERIYGKGYGETKLINNCGCEGTMKSNCTEDEHQVNRRTEFIIVKY